MQIFQYNHLMFLHLVLEILLLKHGAILPRILGTIFLQQIIIPRIGAPEAAGLFAFRKSNTNILSFYCNRSEEGVGGFESMNNGVTNGDTIALNTWVHCAVSRQNGVVRMFLNGSFQDSHEFSTVPIHSAGQPEVGGTAGNTYPMGGYIQGFDCI